MKGAARGLRGNAFRIAVDGMLAAMCAVLGYVSITITQEIKFTLESLPVVIGAMMFGPIDGMLIGGIGTFVYQVVRWGMEFSTPLWVIPYILYGLFVGLIVYLKRYKLKLWESFLLIMASGVLITLLNTGSQIVYKRMLGADTKAAIAEVFAAFPWRLLLSAIKHVAYAVFVPALLAVLWKVPFLRAYKEARNERFEEKDRKKGKLPERAAAPEKENADVSDGDAKF